MLAPPHFNAESPKAPETQKSENFTEQKKTIPQPRVGPPKYEKYRKIRRWLKNDHFRTLSVFFFPDFWGPTLGGGFYYFSVLFRIFGVSRLFGLCARQAGS